MKARQIIARLDLLRLRSDRLRRRVVVELYRIRSEREMWDGPLIVEEAKSPYDVAGELFWAILLESFMNR